MCLGPPNIRKTMKRGMSKARFEAVYGQGIRVHGKHCRIVSLTGTGLTAFTTPKKIGCAARRNRVKRRLRESVRIGLGQIETTWDCIFIANVSAESAPFDELRADVASAMAKLRARWESDSACS